MELYIVRHGQTYWNAQGRLQGRVDIDLNENGREAAISYGKELDAAGVDFDVIYTSPLIRAYETACLIRGRKNIPILRDERLCEICFGDGEGAVCDEWLREDSPYRFFFDQPDKYVPPAHGETLEEVCDRTREFMTQVIEPMATEEKRIMIVAHGALNKGLMSYLEGNSIANFWGGGLQKNCQADIFVYQEGSWEKVESEKRRKLS